jgi:polyisoprenoid-binding protein YceI
MAHLINLLNATTMRKMLCSNFITKSKVIVVSLLLGGMITANAQTPYLLKSSKMTVSGTSSVNDWEENVTMVAWAGQVNVANKEVKDIKNVVIKIPVTSIKSTQGEIMETKTWEAFNYKTHEYITYKLSGMSIDKGVAITNGTLTMNGVTKKVSLKINATVSDSGDVQFTGSHTILMKDFGMTAPAAVMGSIKVGEAVTVKYDLVVIPAPTPTPAPVPEPVK